MARGINRVILVGTVGTDPITNYTPNQTAITHFSIATSESWKDKITGEKVEKTEWHAINIFGKLAEIVDKYVKKGSVVYIEGKLRTDKFKDKSGVDRTKTSIIANELQIISSKKDDGQKSDQPREDKFDDDIPF